MAGSDSVSKFTPLHRLAEKAGARFGDLAGWHVPVGYGALEDEIAAARGRVALADSSANGKVVAEGQEVETVVRAAWPEVTLDVGQGAAAGPGHIYRLRADLFFMSTPPGREAEASQALNAAVRGEDAFVTVTDLSHGRSEQTIDGPRSPQL